MYGRVLVAIDDSEVGKQLLTHAISLAQTSQARLMLAHVLPQGDARCEIPNPIDSAQFQNGHSNLEVMRSYWNQVTAAGVMADFRLPCGHVGEEICELAQKWGADLILMGYSDESESKKPNADTVSRYVLSHASCPLLILPQESYHLPNCFATAS